jgi:beta-xylosidase
MKGADPSDAAFKPTPTQYANPILKGTYPDPAVMRVGKDFYFVSSTFAWFPGLPIFHSTDLVHWNQIGNAIDRPGMLDFKRLGLSRAVFAPTLSHRDGTFYLLNTCVDCQRQLPDHGEGSQGALVGSGVAADGGGYRSVSVLRRRRQRPDRLQRRASRAAGI